MQRCSVHEMQEFSDAFSLARAYAVGDTDPESVLSRVFSSVHLAPNAIITLLKERAIQEAQHSADRWRAGNPLSIFDGVPIAYKDLFDIKGVRTTAGSLTQARALPATRDSAIVAQLRKMGMIAFAKTNLSEFAYSGLGLNPHYGTPQNTIDAQCVVGGSSSGSAAVVGCGLAPVAMGTDTAGSVRIPAAFNGLVGHRSTRKRYNLSGVFPLAPSLDTAGCISHTPLDAYLLDSLLLGRDGVEYLDETPVFDLNSAHSVFFVDTDILQRCDDAVKENFFRFIEKLKTIGFAVVHKKFDSIGKTLELIDSGRWIGSAEAYALHESTLNSSAVADIDVRVRDRLMAAQGITAAQQIELYNLRRKYIAELEAELGTGVLLLPTVAHLPPMLASLERDNDLFAKINLATLRLTMVGSFLDMAVLAVPFASEDGAFPISISLAATAGQDLDVLRTGCILNMKGTVWQRKFLSLSAST